MITTAKINVDWYFIFLLMNNSKTENKNISNDTPNPSYSLELTYLNIDVEYASCNIHKSKVDANNNVNIRG